MSKTINKQSKNLGFQQLGATTSWEYDAIKKGLRKQAKDQRASRSQKHALWVVND